MRGPSGNRGDKGGEKRRAGIAAAVELAHACHGRTRLVLRDRKGDRAFFESFCDDILALDGITEVEGRPLTGSLIITHPETASADIVEAGHRAGLIAIRAAPPPPDPASEFAIWKYRLDEALGRSTGQALSLDTAAALAFFAIAMTQIQRGQFFPPAFTALWYALSLLRNGMPPGGPGASGSDLGGDGVT